MSPFRRFNLGILAGLVPLTASLLSADSFSTADLWKASTDIREFESGDPEIVNALRPIWRKHCLPAIGGALLTSRGLQRLGTLGVRKVGTRAAVTTNDLWHLGSETKAMTAALAASLVERGLLRWDSPVAEIFPELDFHPELKNVTLEQLLTHRSGLAANLPWAELPATENVVAQRLHAVKAAMTVPPLSVPARAYLYSNLGYVVAGAMIERVMNEPWEQSIRKHLFAPLDMRTAGFGGIGTLGMCDQPWGHSGMGQPVPNNGPAMDNPPVLGPAGRVHASMEAWARFLADQLNGARGGSGVLQAATYVKLFTPPSGEEYAFGWLVVDRPWGGGLVYTHAGCNTMNYAVAWLAPQRDFGLLVCINQGDAVAAEAADAAAAALIDLFTR